VTSTERPLITVVIVTWNGRHLLGDVMGGLARQDLPQDMWRVLVLDNASSDGTVEYLAREHPSVRVVRSPENRGFAGGNALALAEVDTPYAVLLNNDATPEPGFLTELLHAVTAEGAERVGALTAKVLLHSRFEPLPPGTRPSVADGDVEGPDGVFRPSPTGTVDLLNSTGNVVDRRGYGRDRGYARVDGGTEDPPEVFAFCGAAALLRMTAVREVGGFDADFFLYYEDTDLSWRLRAAGWSIRYEPRAVVRHRHAASSDVTSTLFRFHDDRNRLLALTKNAPGGLAARAVLRYPLTIASLTLRQGPRAAMTGTRLRALASYLRLLPRMLRRRRAVGRSAAVDRRRLVEFPGE
jgi:GT2 family glycosyltransferase